MYKSTEEDINVYKECFIDLLTDNSPKIMKIMNGYLPDILFNYINIVIKKPTTPKSDEITKA